MRQPTQHPTRTQNGGFSLIEVLIAVLVLAIGLLGLAGLQTTSMQHNHDAQLRTQATLLAYDMADRMRANREVARTTNSYESSFTESACTDGFVSTASSVAARDLDEWRNQLSCYLPQGDGQIQRNGDTLTITVRWTEREADNPDNQRDFVFRTRL
ncbi:MULTISPECIES: type IV pilus modification protein PilV [unclassified Thioalkalivibrio]|uniref:type IV pilus modification protein PilV n=1 Tax=unclassified Thioalkalivibrio TaxID=2621013 RepID=UPI00037FD512|nr:MULTISPECIES: type IV pilus modification protein PilV [unclassified Thioalkalivibrio]